MNGVRNLRSLLLLPRQERESPEVVAAIRGLIEMDREALRYYVRWMSLETSLRWQFGVDTDGRFEVIAQVRRERRWCRVIRILALIAGAAIIGVGVQFWASIIASSVPELQIASAAGFYLSPTRTHWAGDRVKQSSIVRFGDRLQLLAGRFLLHLDSGAAVACTAPVDLKIINGWEIFVHSGDVCVHVPERAHGFRVNTEAVKVVDLGTLFGVRVNELGQADVHVLEGRVTGETSGKPPLEISAGLSRAARMGEPLGSPTPASFEVFTPQLTSLAGVATMTGSVQFLLSPPGAVQKKDLTASGTGYLFQEQPGIELKQSIEIAAAVPGRFDMRHLPDPSSLPAGKVVSTYLIHASNSDSTPVAGGVRFHGKILGLALSAKQLNDTDLLFGQPRVQYPTSSDDKIGRGTIYREDRDWIEISKDGTELTFCIADAKGAFDQIRVFVESNL